MDPVIIILIICCCCYCCSIIGGGGYYYTTTKNLDKPVNSKISDPAIDNNTSAPSTVSTTTPIPTTPLPTTTPIPKGLTIYSDLDFQGKSLFLATGTYDKSFFDKNWTDLGIRSWKSTNIDKLMITFQGTSNGGFGGSSVNVNAPNTGIIFGNNNFIMKGITEFNIFTPEQWKKNFCLSQPSGTMWTSHWADIPPSTCDDYSDVAKYTSLTGKWKTPSGTPAPFSITMNTIGNKGTLNFENNTTDYTFQLNDFAKKTWSSNAFGSLLKLIDDNKIEQVLPIDHPWYTTFTKEQITYVKQ